MRLTFYKIRPKGHFYNSKARRGELRDDAPLYPTGRPDVLKLSRGVEDALTGVIWRDDSQIVSEHIHKRYDERASVEIEITTL